MFAFQHRFGLLILLEAAGEVFHHLGAGVFVSTKGIGGLLQIDGLSKPLNLLPGIGQTLSTFFDIGLQIGNLDLFLSDQMHIGPHLGDDIFEQVTGTP